MSWIHSLCLGIVQALTEFLPVSSSGHLVLFQEFLEIDEATPAFDAMLHIGTALATICFYRKRIVQILTDSLGWGHRRFLGGEPAGAEQREAVRLLSLIVLCTGITAVLALPLKDLFESLFENTTAVGVALLLTGSLLVLTRKYQAKSADEGTNRITLLMAVLIGVAQFIAVTPGISRSGTTISIALLLGLRRRTAAEFSFLISIPAILGANLIQLKDGGFSASPAVILLGTGASFLVGLAALAFLIRLVNRGGFYKFAYYLLPLGALVLLFSLAGGF